MIRRLVESMFVQAYEHNGIADRIKRGGNYVEFSELIGKAAAETVLGLSRNTKRIIRDLKFFGDLAVYNRRTLVPKDDLDRLHQATFGNRGTCPKHLVAKRTPKEQKRVKLG